MLAWASVLYASRASGRRESEATAGGPTHLALSCERNHCGHTDHRGGYYTEAAFRVQLAKAAAALHPALRDSDAHIQAGRLVDATTILKELRSS